MQLGLESPKLTDKEEDQKAKEKIRVSHQKGIMKGVVTEDKPRKEKEDDVNTSQKQKEQKSEEKPEKEKDDEVLHGDADDSVIQELEKAIYQKSLVIMHIFKFLK